MTAKIHYMFEVDDRVFYLEIDLDPVGRILGKGSLCGGKRTHGIIGIDVDVSVDCAYEEKPNGEISTIKVGLLEYCDCQEWLPKCVESINALLKSAFASRNKEVPSV